MPPKKDTKPSKSEIKKKEKIVEDKTFGLKNKKGAKTQKYIQHIQKNQLGNLKKNENEKPKKKEEKKKELEELNTIFKPVQPIQKVEAGVNPKSVLCAFFKQGTCTKGDKCKFSHDMSLARKSATRNYYEQEKEEDKMENWDDVKLKEVVAKKHGDEQRTNKTDIICKYFLEALENNKYGWFWECPNGGDKCIYKHVLPVGFMLKKDMKKEKKEEISIEDLVERERAALGYDLLKITLASFTEWKRKKIQEKRERAAAEAEKKKADIKAGKTVALSGREMFTFHPDLIAEEGQMEEGEAAFDTTTREDFNGDEDKMVDLDLDKLAAEAKEADGSGTIADQQRKFEVHDEEKVQEEAAAAGPINEDLFDDDEDLDDDVDDEDSEEDSESDVDVDEIGQKVKGVQLDSS